MNVRSIHLLQQDKFIQWVCILYQTSYFLSRLLYWNKGLDFSNVKVFASDTCNVRKVVKDGVIAEIGEEEARVLDIHFISHVHSLGVKSAVKSLFLFKLRKYCLIYYYYCHNSVKSVASLIYLAYCCEAYTYANQLRLLWYYNSSIFERLILPYGS